MKAEIKIDATELVGALNDLVKINNDRIEGYEKAASHAENNIALKTLFNHKANQSRSNVANLQKHIANFGGQQTYDTTIAGKVYRGWMDIKNTFNPANSTSILDSCRLGEEAAIKAYNSVLASDAEMSAEIRQNILQQKEDIIKSQKEIKTLQSVSEQLS